MQHVAKKSAAPREGPFAKHRPSMSEIASSGNSGRGSSRAGKRKLAEAGA
jgi:hypothetical protein